MHVLLLIIGDDILLLEKERADIYNRLVDIQEQYWKIDLQKAQGEITSKEREEQIGTLNTEANTHLQDSEELADKLKEVRKAESIFWTNSFGDDEDSNKESTE